MMIMEEKQIVEIPKAELTEASRIMFDSVVTRTYLNELSRYEVKGLVNNDSAPIKWYRITKIVSESNSFFTDKLSMLYMSLHKTAKSVILIIDKDGSDVVNLYIGARDKDKKGRVSGDILSAGMEGYFPGIRFSSESPSEITFTHPSIASVSAIASLRDDKKEDFVQGIERLINATGQINKFRAYFIADSVENEESKGMIDAFNNLYTSLSPAVSLQMSYQETQSHGVSESFTENFTTSIGQSISKTLTHSDGYSENVSNGTNETQNTNYSENCLRTFWSGIFGGKTGTSKSISTNRTESIGKNFSNSEANQTGSQKTEQKGTAKQNGTNDTETTGTTKQLTYTNRQAQYYLDIIDKQVERLQNGSPFGLWSTAVYFLANDSTTSQQLANIYRGTIIGEESGLESCAINVWKEGDKSNHICKYLGVGKHPLFDFNSLEVTAGSMVTSKELAIHLSFPQSSVPGIIVEEQPSFSRNIMKKNGEIQNSSAIELGRVHHLGKTTDTNVALDIQELSKHVFVTGSTGSGKSNTMYGILSSLKEQDIEQNKEGLGNEYENQDAKEIKGKITFMVIEPAKGEYKHVFGHDEDVTVYSTTPRFGKLLRINPFEFQWESVDVFEHIDRLVDIFNACWPMYAAMPSVLKNAIINSYKKCGWNLISTTNKYSFNGKPVFPTIDDVLVCLKEYINSSEYSDEAKGDYKGALETRLTDLNTGLMGLIFSGNSITDDELFNHNSIIDLSRVSATDKAFFMGLIILKLNEFRMSEGSMNQKLRHVTVIEEAHNLLKRTSTEQGQESANLIGKSVEMITNSIAEMRTYGEGFIIVDQSPSLLDSAAIRNTNTKIVMSLPEFEDREIAGKSMALTDEQTDQIAKQGVGEAIVYQNSWESPVQCKINLSGRDTNLIYSKVYQLPQTIDRKFRMSVVNFILQPYTKKQMDVAEITKYVTKDIMPSGVRVELLQLLEEFNDKGTISLWKKSKFAKLSQVVANYLDIDKEVANLKSLITGVNGIERFRLSFDELLSEKLGEDIETVFSFYIQQGYIQKLKPEYYKGWKKTFKFS